MSGTRDWSMLADFVGDRLAWHVTLVNLRQADNAYLYHFRASCEKMLNNQEHQKTAQFMLDAIDHVLKERENNG